MSRVRVQIMNQFHRKSHEYKAIKRYWKLIQQDSRKLSDKRFYRPTFRPFQLQLSFASSMTFTLSMIFLGFQRLCLGMSMPSLRER
ncbi:transposase [Streptococcus pneumoniae]|nr:transposase [Streptococcus pneumoniae]